MPFGHSDRACQLCRQRRVKCDKLLPTCMRCRNSNRPCPGYPAKRKFIDQSSKYTGLDDPAEDQLFPVTFESPKPPSPQKHAKRLSLNASPQERYLLDRSPATLPISNLTSRVSTGDSLRQNTLTSPQTSNLIGQEDSELQFFDLDIDSYSASTNNACGIFPGDLQELVDSEPEATAAYNELLWQDSPANVTSFSDDLSPLLQLFVESLAPWMDLFDVHACFSRVISHSAASDVLLQFALAAVAAKQAARYLSTEKSVHTMKSLDRILAACVEQTASEWFYKAAGYYDQGISQLRFILNHILIMATPFRSPQPFGDRTLSFMNSPSAPDAFANSDRPGQQDTLQNVLSAISIFSFYENLDDCLTKPSQHISGFLALIHHTHTPSLAPQADRNLVFAARSAGRAAFWYFARKEMFAAYVHRVRPALDPDDLSLWSAAGLPENICSCRDTHDFGSQLRALATYAANEDCMTKLYVLVWMSTRVIKFVADLEHDPESIDDQQDINHSGASTTQRNGVRGVTSRRLAWITLREQLQLWHQNRSTLFHSYATGRCSRQSKSGRTLDRTVLFTTPMGAAVVQLYHFVQMLLLLNRPFESPHGVNQAARLQLLKNSTEEVEYHSKEICAIACGNSISTIQRQMSHPLQLAGVYFDTAADRDMVLQLLTSAAAETCSASDDMLRNVLKQWHQNDSSRDYGREMV